MDENGDIAIAKNYTSVSKLKTEAEKFMKPKCCLYKIIFPKIRLQDRIFYRSKNKSDIFGVGSTSKVGVDDFFWIRIELYKHPQNELTRGCWIAVVSGVLGEVCPQVTRLDLLLQKVLLVKK